MSRDYTRSDLEDPRYAEPSTPGGVSDRQIEQPDRPHSSAQHSRAGNHVTSGPDAHTIPARCHDSRSAYYARSPAYRLRRSEIQT